jgi:hypothetical protein
VLRWGRGPCILLWCLLVLLLALHVHDRLAQPEVKGTRVQLRSLQASRSTQQEVSAQLLAHMLQRQSPQQVMVKVPVPTPSTKTAQHTRLLQSQSRVHLAPAPCTDS